MTNKMRKHVPELKPSESGLRFLGAIKLPPFLRWTIPHLLISLGCWSLLGVIVVWFVASSFFGDVINQDECYMNLCCRYYSDQPLAMLTFYVGWLWMGLFGDQVISMRLLAVLCYLFTAFFPVYYFYRRTGNLLWSVFLFTVELILIECGQILFYGWDVGVYVYESALLALCMTYIDRPSLKKGLIMAAVLTLMIFARVPTAVLGVPAVLWVVIGGAKRHGLDNKWICGVVVKGVAVSFAIALAVMCVMKGSPLAYIRSWIPDNIITGHGLRDILYGYFIWMAYDIKFYANVYGFWIDAFLSLSILLFFDHKSRNFIGLVLLVGVCAIIHHTVYLAWMFIPVALLLYPVVHNALVRSGCRGGDIIKADGMKLALLLIFAFVPVAGSDRIIMRIVYFYSIPFIMVWLYPWRNGIIKWLLVFTTLPAACYSICCRVLDLSVCQRLDDVLPYHKYIIDYPGDSDYVAPLAMVVRRLENEGKKFGTFGEFRYGPVYLYEKEKPYRLNTFHNYYPEETESVLRDFARHLDALFVQNKDTPALTFYEIQDILYSEGYEAVAVAGSYWVFEKDIAE